jgi:penicillin-binding protein 2
MPNNIFRKIRKRIRGKYKDISPEDIFLDAANLPGFKEERFEGRMEKPVAGSSFLIFKAVLALSLVLLFGRLFTLELMKGDAYQKISENNRLEHTVIFANRGVIYDRNDVPLAENAVKPSGADFAARVYPEGGLSHVVGYVKYPAKDSSGYYYDATYRGKDGIERVYNDALTGKDGLKISETDARGRLVSESVLEKPEDGKPLKLSLDAGVTKALYSAIESTAKERGFTGGAGIIMDVETGEILAMTSYPEYDPNVMTSGTDKQAVAKTLTDPTTPLLNRAVNGLYTPGSIVKPIVALAALTESVISPEKKILSTGALTLPNPYDPKHPSIFKDWKAHGYVNVKDALAVSSDVYFYEVGGGFQDQPGLGITKLDKYFSLFGLDTKTGIDLPSESSGTISTPDWKKKNFSGEDWLLGDTYHTAIGQYGTQVTPLEAVRWVAALANGGKLLVPSLLYGGRPEKERVSSVIPLHAENLQIVRDGMRQGVTSGIAQGLSIPDTAVAAKSGTAELGFSKARVNSWITGFFPYDHPHYAFALLMEKGPVANLVGATSVMRKVLDWMSVNSPEYFK